MADSPPGSPLSSLASEEFTEDMKFEDQAHSPLSTSTPNMPPSKRRRTGFASWDRNTPISSIHDEPVPASPSTSISSDTSGEVPNSPNAASVVGGFLPEDDYSGQGNDQVTACRWEDCDAGELGNMDDLVKHIHNEHIGTRQKKYSCEWSDCTRKGQTHASGYALRAHMRSHTREKPFYCALPECDRSFTRSDALAKHMRTVHETEALRPSDPIPKHHGPGTPGPATTSSNKLPRLKLKLSHPSKDGAHNGNNDRDADIEDAEALPIPEFGPDLGFDEHELSLTPQQLYRVLRRQIHWAEQETDQIKREWEEVLEPLRKETWKEKESILEDVINAEIKVLGSGEGAEGFPTGGGGVWDRMDAIQEKEEGHLFRIQEPTADPADDESVPAENGVSMMESDVSPPDIPTDVKPLVGLEDAMEQQPG